jgi:Protein of unknown function (DUF2975)
VAEGLDKTMIFKFLDKFFWIVWVALPVLIWMTFRTVLAENTIVTDIGKVSAACAEMIPQVGNFSTAGKAVAFTYIVSNFLVFGVLLVIAHVTIHRFAQGNVFVANTIRALKHLGLIIVAWPFFDLIATNATSYAFTLTGDLKTFDPNFLFDVAPFGVGLLVLTIHSVLQHAIELQHDQDLTI